MRRELQLSCVCSWPRSFLLPIAAPPAANCSPSLVDRVRLNVTLLSSPNIVDNVRFSEKKRSGVPKPCRIEAGIVHPGPDEGLPYNVVGHPLYREGCDRPHLPWIRIHLDPGRIGSGAQTGLSHSPESDSIGRWYRSILWYPCAQQRGLPVLSSTADRHQSMMDIRG